MKRKLLSGACLVVALTLFTVSADASSITSLYLNNASNLISDESYEYLINNGGGATTVDVGDVLTGIFRVDQLVNDNNVSGYLYKSDWTNELSAYFAVEVLTKSGDIATGFTWTFGPVQTEATSNSDFTDTYGSGAMVVVFEDPNQEFNPATIAGGIAGVVDGQMYWTLGFDGNSAEGWRATAATDDISQLGTTPGGTNSGVVNFALDVLAYGVGPQLLRDTDAFTGLGKVDINGDGNFVKPTITTEFPIKDDVNATFVPVPEPATLALLGFGLIGLAAAARRRMK